MNEQRAIQLCLKHRDPIGFEFLVRKYRREAFVHARALLGNEHDALDVCQDAFVKAFAAIPQLDALSQFYPWFYCILRNRCFNLLARQQTSTRYQRSQEAASVHDTESAQPSSILEQQEDRERLQMALEALRPEHREILTMKYFQDYSYEQIAGILGIPRGTVMSRLYHARTALREAYSKPEGAETPQATKDPT
jgi:RNA polymerase sigma-70 factor (ECF subfamily)